MKMNICIVILNSYRYLLILSILQITGSHPCVKLYCYVDAQLFLVQWLMLALTTFRKYDLLSELLHLIIFIYLGKVMLWREHFFLSSISSDTGTRNSNHEHSSTCMSALMLKPLNCLPQFLLLVHTDRDRGQDWYRDQIDIGPRQGEGLGPIVPYCASPVPCTVPDPISVQCEYTVTPYGSMNWCDRPCSPGWMRVTQTCVIDWCSHGPPATRSVSGVRYILPEESKALPAIFLNFNTNLSTQSRCYHGLSD